MARRTIKAQTPPAPPPAKAKAETAAEPAPDLVGVPYLGPVRRAALAAAGVETRATLARASVDQLVGMTGIGRGLAQRVLDALHAAAENASAPVAPATDEAMPAATEAADETPVSVAATQETETVAEPGDEPTDTGASEFDRALFAARTALSDATRTFAASEKLQKPFVRLAKRLDMAGNKNAEGTLGAGRTARIHKRLLVLTDRLEAASNKADAKPLPLTPKREDRLRERVQNESRALAKLMQPKPLKAINTAVPPSASGAKRNAAPKPTKKTQK